METTAETSPRGQRDPMDHEPVLRALVTVLERLATVAAGVDYRLVGGAASLLHGVRLPVRDVDILMRDRPGVDLFSKALSGLPVLSPPTLLEEDRQYLASFDVGGVEVELSTVEWETDSDAIECLGRGPWEHFALVPCGSGVVPTVAPELRLVTEVTRNRPERYRPITAFLREHGCDLEMVRRGFAARRIPAEREREILALLGGAAASD